MLDVRIDELETEDEWKEAFPVMRQLWKDTSHEFTRDSFVELLHELTEIEGYRLFGLFVDETIVALAGASLRMSAWYGRYLWVYDLVTDADHRSRGYGKQLLSHLKRWAENRQCETIALASGLDRENAHRFYENANMEKSSYVFKQTLNR
ncbi:GNAT family N-acetyltransferase [Halorussus aquaticus]|uniref:GNAT family N-acetyltransferase n=1 Tax=Halorussus aquaticus TaxID=2953748 RepID=A0ABD5Q2N5_9EURY|nr:GNAT family N-acetyltransferase [Halorussus aquaticus]